MRTVWQFDFVAKLPKSQLVEKIIPAFERAHSPMNQALFLIDNSQGHAAYAVDALLTSRMNLKPGGKQARLRRGWFMCGNEKVPQDMVFPHNHPDFPNEPKGMKQVLIERGLWREKLLMKCKESCEVGATNCCATRILDLQSDFKEQ